MNLALALLTLSGPLLLLLSGVVPNAWCDRRPNLMRRLFTGAAHIALLTSLIAVAGFLNLGRVDRSLVGLEIYLDALSAIMLLLVAGIGTVVIRYSRRYLDGDPGQGHFFKWLALTIGAVLVLVISGNLIQFTLAWMATSLSLHRLLLFYPERAGARLAARKKFVISRLGDLCLIGAMLLIYHAFGSLHFGEIFADAELHARHATEGLSPWSGPGLFWTGLLLVFGAALKSAQFPFHSWLPEVMETPTPVSALMHAGIINAGGFLIVRMSPVMALSPTALNLLAVIGAVTALFGDEAERQRELERLDLLNVLQLAYELHGQGELAARLAGASSGEAAEPPPATRKSVQAVFCIDVRSEIFRRALETSSPEVETLGFAGFFGFPIEYIPLGHHHRSAQCPVLIAPRYRIRESVADADVAELRGILHRRWLRKRLNRLWKSFKTSAVSCFSYVEIAGLLFGVKLVTDSLGLTRPVAKPGAAGLDLRVARRIRPLVTRQRGRLLAQSPVVETGMTLNDRIELAANALRGMGLTEDFARVVLLCGHGSSTVKNPYGSGLDCGACGGHSGEANARVAAMVLNDREVRAGLWSRGIVIPDDTWFVASLHDTTTDRVTLFDLEEAPEHATRDLARLQVWLAQAGQLTRQERAGSLGLDRLAPAGLVDAVRARGHDWSEVRPEWGLAGNAAFIAAPRRRTRGISLEGRAFLHEYDYRLDPEGAILSLIMTAPMVVASWINLQYYASTVDNRLFGSGNKVLHNMVGAFGVLEGNGGDLRVGLPWQSVHDGHDWRHEPRRLKVLIEAPAAAIERVLEQQAEVRQLVAHHWLHLLRIDPDQGLCHRYRSIGHWESLTTPA